MNAPVVPLMTALSMAMCPISCSVEAVLSSVVRYISVAISSSTSFFDILSVGSSTFLGGMPGPVMVMSANASSSSSSSLLPSSSFFFFSKTRASTPLGIPSTVNRFPHS